MLLLVMIFKFVTFKNNNNNNKNNCHMNPPTARETMEHLEMNVFILVVVYIV